MKLFIVDAISPFFQFEEKGLVNWSKIPFKSLETKQKVDPNKLKKVESDYKTYIKIIKSLGYNAITLDDIAHIINYPFYPKPLQNKINAYHTFYEKLFSHAKKEKLKVFLTTEANFHNKHILKNEADKNFFLRKHIQKLFNQFPDVDGVILRFGESDGIDVVDDFESSISIKNPEDLNRLLKGILPIFREYNKYLICRTWSLGAYKIGDIMWNKKTFMEAFKGIRDDKFIISMKYGESDFFRYIEISDLFVDKTHKKIIELQAKREYEGFGQFPAFVGYEYQKYLKFVSNLPHIVGVKVWAQTGGWSTYKSLTFGKNSSIWNELNVYTIIKMAKYKVSPKKAIKDFWKWKYSKKTNEAQKFLEIINASEELIKNAYYTPSLSSKNFYIKRVMLPSIITPWWQTFAVSDLVRAVFQLKADANDFSKKSEEKINKLLDNLHNEANQIGIDLGFQKDTFSIIFMCKRLLFEPQNKPLKNNLEKKLRRYHKKYEKGYNFEVNYDSNKVRLLFYKFLVRLVVREEKRYRKRDKLLGHPLITRLLIIFKPLIEKGVPSFVNKIGSPIDTFLK